MKPSDKIAVACGGTGGHTFPGLATARVLRDRGFDVEVLAAGRSIEAATLKGWDGPVFKTGARQLKPKYVLHILAAIFRVFRHFAKNRPVALLAMGSYSIVPPVIAAWLLRIPVVLHEANSVPGKANVFFSRMARKVAVSFKSTERYFPKRKTVYTGMPVRRELLDQPPRDKSDGDFVVFVTGGSQGARFLNDTLPTAMAFVSTSKRIPGLRVVHQAGPGSGEAVRAKYAELHIKADVSDFVSDMGAILKVADVVIARAGAATCAEICIFGTPSILVPLPSAVGDHQFHNAESMVDSGAAIVVRQNSCSPEWLSETILEIAASKLRMQKMRDAALKIASPDAVDLLADVVSGVK